MEDKLKSAIMFLGGVAVGTMIGVLLAPESGDATRRKLSKQLDDLKGNLGDSWESGKNRISSLKKDAIAEAEKLSKRVTKATE
jgi:gas vesicle protein